MIYIYYSYLSEKNHDDLLKKELPRFTIDFQEKIKSYKRWQDAQLSLLGRLLLFKAIEEIYIEEPCEKEIKYSKYNKPCFENNSPHFNISHSGEIAICAVNIESEIGIDIEMISDIEIMDFKLQITQKEWDHIEMTTNKIETFFDYWTQKESVLKAHGHGLTIPLKSFEISNNTTKINEEKYYLKEIKIDKKYKCYIALKMRLIVSELNFLSTFYLS